MNSKGTTGEECRCWQKYFLLYIKIYFTVKRTIFGKEKQKLNRLKTHAHEILIYDGQSEAT